MECVERSIRNAPTIEVVPKELYEQILWERNIAMEQLEEHRKRRLFPTEKGDAE